MCGMKTIWYVAILIMVAACTPEVEQRVMSGEANGSCDYPLILKGGRCCMDTDNNTVCDKEENKKAGTGTQVNEKPSTIENPSTIKAPVTPTKKPEVQETPQPTYSLSDKLGDFTETSAELGYIGPFTREDATILFDSTGTTGSLVMAALQMKLFLNNPTSLEVETDANTLSENKLNDILKSHMILLGNGCNNDLIAEIADLKGEGCEGTTKGTGLIKFYENGNKQVMIVIGYDDLDVYELQKKIINDDVEIEGNQVTVSI
jgi:hypothetical protein